MTSKIPKIEEDEMLAEFCQAGELYKRHRDYEELGIGSPLTNQQKRQIARHVRAIGMFLKMGGQNMIAPHFLIDSDNFSTI